MIRTYDGRKVLIILVVKNWPFYRESVKQDMENTQKNEKLNLLQKGCGIYVNGTVTPTS